MTKPTASEIAALLRELRRLTASRPIDPVEREAWLAKKRELLARIEHAEREET
jgi:hypothetical protein